MPRTADLVAKVSEYIAAKGIGLKEPLVAGLSGGADSVCLLLVLQKLGVTPVCVHINHMIRGKEADRDEEFCRSLCEKLGVKFVSYKCNVPEYAKEKVSARKRRRGKCAGRGFTKSRADADQKR